jgi:hypothetical protein
LLNKANLAIAKLCPKDDGESQLVLTGILCTPDYTVMTDGHRLIKVSTTDASADRFPNFDDFKAANQWEPFILKRDDALAICVAIPKEQKEQSLWSVKHAAINELNPTELATNDLSTKHLFKTEHLAGKYPEFEKVIPEKGAAAFVAPVNARYLMEMLKAVVDSSPNFPLVELRFYRDDAEGQGKAMRLDAKTADQQEWIGVLMPMRINPEENGKNGK